MTLCYVFPGGLPVMGTKPTRLDLPYYDIWLQTMIEANPDTIFFYTVPTTDIFDHEVVASFS